MKILFLPASGRRGLDVFYPSRYGMASRRYCIPANVRSPAQQRVREAFGSYARMWGRKLSQEQRDLWNEEGPNIWSDPRCGTLGKLTGEQFFTGINSTLACCNLPPLWTPPARVIFPLSIVRELVIEDGQDGVRLFLRLAAPPTEDIMVFGQEPRSAGRSKRRNVSYPGLLPPAEDGRSEISGLYTAKYGEPRPGTKVFIVTCQQKNGWKGMEQETSEIVPPGGEGQMANGKGQEPVASEIVPDRPEGQQAAAQRGNSQKPLMHKGCTPGARGTSTPGVRPSLEAPKTGEGGGKAAGAAIGGDGGGG